MVDVSRALTDQQFLRCRDILELEPGDWRRVETVEMLDTLLKEIDVPSSNLDELKQARDRGECSIAAGSSILGMLSSMHPQLRTQSFLASAIASSDREHAVGNPFFEYFYESISRSGISHYGEITLGSNPIGLVLSRVSSKEKMLATFQGVAQDFDADSIIFEQQPEYILVDAYEMQHGKLRASIDNIVRSGRFKIALSLGNRAILDLEMTQRIRKHIDSGNIHILCGNREEYAALYPEVPDSMYSDQGFGEHPVSQFVPFSLVTDGPRGLVGRYENSCLAMPAYPIEDSLVVNTSGAGDTAMGAFCNGIIRREPLKDTLARSAFLASQVLCVPGSRLEDDAILTG